MEETSERELLVVKEFKKRIENIKKKYNNLEMSDEAAELIGVLEIVSWGLKTSVTAAGIITTIDCFFPAGISAADKAIVAAISSAFTSGSEIIDNQIQSIVAAGELNFSMSDLEEIRDRIIEILEQLKNKKEELGSTEEAESVAMSM